MSSLTPSYLPTICFMCKINKPMHNTNFCKECKKKLCKPN